MAKTVKLTLYFGLGENQIPPIASPRRCAVEIPIAMIDSMKHKSDRGLLRVILDHIASEYLKPRGFYLLGRKWSVGMDEKSSFRSNERAKFFKKAAKYEGKGRSYYLRAFVKVTSSHGVDVDESEGSDGGAAPIGVPTNTMPTPAPPPSSMPPPSLPLHGRQTPGPQRPGSQPPSAQPPGLLPHGQHLHGPLPAGPYLPGQHTQPLPSHLPSGLPTPGSYTPGPTPNGQNSPLVPQGVLQSLPPGYSYGIPQTQPPPRQHPQRPQTPQRHHTYRRSRGRGSRGQPPQRQPPKEDPPKE